MSKMSRKLIVLFCFLHIVTLVAQKGFQFESSKSKVSIPFQLINNLIFIEIKVNGVPLNFLLDTGVEETILLSLEENEQVNFFNVQKITLKGLGSAEAIEGLKSTNNVLDVNGIIDRQHDLYIVLDQDFNFSSHVGIPVNGIIGYHLFKNFPVEINYDKRKIYIYKDSAKLSKRLAKFTQVPITLEKNKPYAMASVNIGKQEIPTKLLLDIGNSDAFWLFENKQKGIAIPEKNFNDYLGKGFSGEINGSRAKISAFTIGDFQFTNPIVSFPDSLSLKSVNLVKNRAGSTGGEIFRRFNLVMDYPNKKLYLKKGARFDEEFRYNMSGLELQNEGLQWVQETVLLQTAIGDNTFDASGNKSSFKYKFSLKPVYTVLNVRQNSPADLAGLKRNDIVTSINGNPTYKYSLEAINSILKSEDGKWIRLEVERGGERITVKFQLKSIL